jgi:hypothetical protein
MRTNLLSVNPKVRDHLRGVGVYMKIILKWMLSSLATEGICSMELFMSESLWRNTKG